MREKFPKELDSLLEFEEFPEIIVVRPITFLGNSNFSKAAAVVRGLGGEYVSAGKESHFKIPREAKPPSLDSVLQDLNDAKAAIQRALDLIEKAKA